MKWFWAVLLDTAVFWALWLVVVYFPRRRHARRIFDRALREVLDEIDERRQRGGT